MGKTYEAIDDKIQRWIERQHMFFVATAPLASTGLINCSPKGLDTLRVLDPHTLIYLEYTGSGAETIAHIRENGRLLIMLCAFEGPPRIYRFYGRGEVIPTDDPQFHPLTTHFNQDLTGVRSIVRLYVERIADSCGFGVPEYTYRGQRTALTKYANERGDAGMAEYRMNKNLASTDGLPALTPREAAALATDKPSEF